MKPEDLTIEDLEKCADLPVRKWHGLCRKMAAATHSIIKTGRWVWGDYLGLIDKNGYYGERSKLNRIIGHAWILLDDERALDPTRWVFEHVDPYIYIGNADDYDEVGNDFRTLFNRSCPTADKGRLVNLKTSASNAALFERLTTTPFDKLTIQQLAWIATTPYDELGSNAVLIYETLVANDLKTLIPICSLQQWR